jgi:adenylate kinase family enzyme
MLRDQPRIVVVGTSGSGKTTLARRLADALGRRHIELDALHWGPNWTPRPEFVELVEEAIALDSWVIDGNYSKVRDAVWRRATALIWLNYSFPLVFCRALSRTVERIVGQRPTHGGNRDSFRKSFLSVDGIPWWVVRSYHRRRRDYRELLSGRHYPQLLVFEVTRPAQADALLAEADSVRCRSSRP